MTARTRAAGGEVGYQQIQVSFVLKPMKFVSEMMKSVSEMMNSALKRNDFEFNLGPRRRKQDGHRSHVGRISL